MPKRRSSRNKARGTIAKFVGGHVKIRRSVHTSTGASVFPHNKSYRRMTIKRTLVRRKGRG